jgi:DNA invertase Pin-like site-specific DNA recombinase
MDRMQSGRPKAAIYVRVSTADQHVESQLYDLRELAAQRGLDVRSGHPEQKTFRLRSKQAGNSLGLRPTLLNVV